jgi:regulator of protease activity HflC (stomatin/prohibitin superfamily)
VQTEIFVGFFAVLFFLFFILPIIFSTLRIIQEYERVVIFRLGRTVGIRGPGLIFVLPFIEKPVKIDLRIRVIEIPRQEIMSADNVPVSTNAICFYQVQDPMKAIIEVERYQEAVFQLAQATTRSIVGESYLDDVLSDRDKLNEKIKRVIGENVENWGLTVYAVEIKDVELPDSMKRAMARQAEAERDKRGRIIQAEGEEIASKLLADAALILRGNNEGLHLRTLQTLTEIGAEHHTTTILVIPMDTLAQDK